MLISIQLITTVALILLPLMTKIALATSPTASSSEVSSLYCYMQINDGKTLNLAALCGDSTPKSSTEVISDADKKVIVSDLSYDDYTLKGQASNQTGETIKSATINYEVLDSEGKLVDAGLIESKSLSVPPGDTIPFEKQTNQNHPGGQIRITSIDWHY